MCCQGLPLRLASPQRAPLPPATTNHDPSCGECRFTCPTHSGSYTSALLRLSCTACGRAIDGRRAAGLYFSRQGLASPEPSQRFVGHRRFVFESAHLRPSKPHEVANGGVLSLTSRTQQVQLGVDGHGLRACCLRCASQRCSLLDLTGEQRVLWWRHRGLRRSGSGRWRGSEHCLLQMSDSIYEEVPVK